MKRDRLSCLQYHVISFVTLLTLLLTGSMTVAAGPARSQQQELITMETIGTAEAKADDTSSAKNAAIENALKVAIDEALSRIVPAEVLADNFPTIDSLFQGAAQSHILTYSVLAVHQHKDLCRVLTRVSVPAAQIRRRIENAGILLDRDTRPRVLLLISEKKPDQPLSYWWQKPAARQTTEAGGATVKALADNLEKRGIRCLTHTPKTGTAGGNLKDRPDIDRETTLRLARKLKAGFVIMGRAQAVSPSSEASDPAESKDQWKATLKARLYNVENKKHLDEIMWEGRPAETEDKPAVPDGALEAAGMAAARKLSPLIVAAFQQIAGQSRKIQVVFQGDNYLNRLSSFQEQLSALDAVSGFQLNEMEPNQAVFTVTYAGSANDLAGELSSGEKQVDIKNVSQQGIVVQSGTFKIR